jgi:hypothetical protein
LENYLVLHIDLEFIVGAVCSDKGISYPITNSNNDLLWLYFFNNPQQNRISFGKENRAHFNNKELNYYGRFFDLIENEQEKFTIRDIKKRTIELLEYSELLKILKEKYRSITHETPDKIPTLITFSLSIGELAKQKTVEYLKTQGFQIESYTIPLSELACYYPFNKKEFTPGNGNVVLLLAATNTTLHLMKLTFSSNYFMIDGEIKTYKGKGIDPRKKALVKFVVNEINNTTGALSSEKEKEEECEKMEPKAEEWLKRIDAQLQNNKPFRIVESISKMPNTRKEVLVRKDNIESDTGHYIQELMDIFEAYKSDNVRSDLAAIFLLGDCFQNSLVKGRFSNLIHNEKLFIYTNKDILDILSVYPQIDFKRYIDQEERSKAIAEAEEQKQAEQRALEDKRRKEQEEENKRIAADRKAEQNLKEAQKLFDREIELEKEGKLEDARINAENALSLDKTNREYKQFVSDLVEKINTLNAKNELYKSYLSKDDKLLEKGELANALEEYEAAQHVFDNAEITKKIIEVKRLIKNAEQKREKLSRLVLEAQSSIKQEEFSIAKEKINEILVIDKDNSLAKSLLTKTEQGIQQKEIQQKETENTAKCEKIIAAANNLFSEEKWAEAKAQYEMALSLCPQEKNIKDKIKQCTAQIKAKEDAFSDLMLEATVAEKKGSLKQSLENLEKALKIKPNNAELKSRIKKIKFDLNFGSTKSNNDDGFPKEQTKEDDFLGISKKKNHNKTNEDDDFIVKNPRKPKDEDNDFLNPRNRK